MKVEIVVDGQELELNDFVKKITYNLSSSLVNSLRDVPKWSTIEIRLRK